MKARPVEEEAEEDPEEPEPVVEAPAPQAFPPPMALGAAPMTFEPPRRQKKRRKRAGRSASLKAKKLGRIDLRAPVSMLLAFPNFLALLIMVPLGAMVMSGFQSSPNARDFFLWLLGIVFVLPVSTVSVLAAPVRAIEKHLAIRRARDLATGQRWKQGRMIVGVAGRWTPLVGVNAVSIAVVLGAVLLAVGNHSAALGALYWLPVASFVLPFWNLSKGPWRRRRRLFQHAFERSDLDLRPVSEQTWDEVVRRYRDRPLLTRDGTRVWDPFGGCPIDALELLCSETGREALAKAGLQPEEPKV